MNDFTQYSGIAFDPDGGWGIGMECGFTETGAPAVVERIVPVGISGLSRLSVFGGSVKLVPRPVEFHSGLQGGGQTRYHMEFLCRVSIIGDNQDVPITPLSGKALLNVILAGFQPVILPIAPFMFNMPAWPADGSAYRMRVRFEVAGFGISPRTPVGTELQMCGEYQVG